MTENQAHPEARTSDPLLCRRFIEYPAAVVTGPEAFLLSRVLKAPSVVAFLRRARWFHGGDVQAMLEAIDRAARAWESRLTLAQRHTALRSDPLPAHSRWTVEQAAKHLGLSHRRVQELARAGWLTGKREGRRWGLDEASVLNYQHRRGVG
jgi:excisionase family DNA binding protein